jgi:hypothetical protein
MKFRREKLLFVFLIILLFAVNYNFLNNMLEKNFSPNNVCFVERVIDGDTVVMSSGEHIRMLGINTPETTGKEFYSEEAKKFTEENVLNKTILLKSSGKDLYGRELAYLFYKRQNINLEIVRKGYANYYFPSGKDAFSEEFFDAWDECILDNKNLCEKSQNKCANCIVLSEFNFKKDEATFSNQCSFDCSLKNWEVKDEGRKKFVFEDFILKKGESVSLNAEDFGKNYVWTNSGDTLFLRDDEGKLVLWERKNY